MEKGSGKKRRRPAYLVHFGGGPHGSRVDLLAEEGLRLDAGYHEEHADRVVQVVLDGATPDDPRLRVDLLSDDLRRLLGLGDGQIRPADDAHERATGVGQVDLAEKRRLQRLVDRVLDPIALLLALADADHRDAAALHDRHQVRVVEVHEAGLRDDLVRHLERRVDRQAGDELEELVVVDHDRRVAELSELIQARLRVLHPDAAFRLEGHRDDAHRQRALLLADARDVLRRAGAGPAAHPGRDEHDVGAADEVADILFALVRGLLPDLRERPGAEALRQTLADEDLLGGSDGKQVLRVRVDGAQLRAADAGLAAPVDRVRAAAAATDDLDRDVDRFDNLLDLLVVAGLGFVLRLRGFRGFALFLFLGFLVSGQGLVQKRFHRAIPSRMESDGSESK